MAKRDFNKGDDLNRDKSGKAQTDKSERSTKEIEQRKQEYKEWKDKKK